MATLFDASSIVHGTPLPKLKKVSRGEGEVVNPLGLSFTWKVKGADTGFAFAVYEMAIAPAASIPMHVHPFAEYFYVLEGAIDVMGLAADGTVEWTSLATGDSANAPSNAPHGITNRSDKPAKFLSTANFQHEESFNQIVALMTTPAVEAMSAEEQADLFIRLAGERQVYFIADDQALPRDHVKDMCDQMRAAWRAGDAERFGGVFSADARFVAFDGTTVNGPAAIAEFHAGPFESYLASTELVLDVQETRAVGDGATVVFARGGITKSGDLHGDLIGESAQMFIVAPVEGTVRITAFQNTRIRPIDGAATADIWKQFDRAWSGQLKAP